VSLPKLTIEEVKHPEVRFVRGHDGRRTLRNRAAALQDEIFSKV
jgi:hypothetical protein